MVPVVGKEDAFNFVADRWKKEDLRDSRYVWLPLRFEDGKPVVEWRDAWDLSVFGGR